MAETNKISEALKAGKVITNRANWKNKQKLTSAFVAVGAFILAGTQLFFPDLAISSDDVVVWSGIAATLLGVANRVITTITSETVGKK